MKFCKDCKNAYLPFVDWLFLGGYRFAKCRRKYLSTIDKVTGEEKYLDTFCSTEREDYGIIDSCGTDAKYFEAKK